MHTNVDQEQIGRRLQAERMRLGMTQKSLAEATGVSKTTQANYETGFRTPDACYLARLAELGADLVFVVTGQPPPRAQAPAELVPIAPLLPGERPAAPGTAAEAPARYGAPALSVRREWLAARDLDAAHLRAARVSGSLMQGVLNEGDLALVDVSDTSPRAGYVYAVLQGAELLFRYCTPLPGGSVRVSAANGPHAQFDVEALDRPDFRVLGRVVATVHDL